MIQSNVLLPIAWHIFTRVNSILLKSEFEGRATGFGEANRICESRGSKLISVNEIISNTAVTYKLFE